MSNSSYSSQPVGRVLWDELPEEVILHITPLCSLLHKLLKDGECVCRMSENCKSLILQDKCNIEIFLSPERKILILGHSFNLMLLAIQTKIFKIKDHEIQQHNM